MQVKYVGPHAAVEVETPDQGWQRVTQGGTITVPDEYGASLLEQGSNWQKAAPPRKATPADDGSE